jgi:GT2 family glycosyltransferase
MTMSPSVPAPGPLTDVGVVIIGRNEGDRLIACLKSVVGRGAAIIYVDSQSTDGSVAEARALNVHVIELDLTTPFTAARARNAGFAALMKRNPDISFVQFVDGDCSVVDDWLAAGRAYLHANAGVAAVFGRRRERFPHASIFNQLCDEEWATEPGDAKYCGGDVMFRASALQAVGGYRDGLIAGEEPELCVRLRQQGHRIVCLPLEMTRHDAAMTSVGQWWRRCLRSGHSFAEGAWLHGAPPERHWVRETQRIWLWGFVLPLAIVVTALFSRWLAVAIASLYVIQFARLYMRKRQSSAIPVASAFFQVAGNIPEAQGQLRFHTKRLTKRRSTIIEYK